ncbi:hypothetical protein TRFO_31561 [Tritrichomonas foetus]|uniref:Uncharacterized protein n=1 Tax=Tritrichomonas foetus TaxID=1144522 RepID=A0A1J4JS10_9EUKA|nr:hypothetical protein TRFO_31561 [Tritrichomonas foetus]|eukprot:OHT01538.1 hypothetical protein TRFO_31561 [Tritrichomonas foetus]
MLSSQSESSSPSSDEINDAKHLQESNNQLRQMNEKLLLELNSLRQQFNEATSIGKQLEEIHSKNSKLASDLRKVTAERDELSHRLDLNILVIDELRTSKEQERNEMERRIQSELNDARESFEKERFDFTDNIKKAQNEAKEALRQMKTTQNDCDNLSTSIKEAVEAAQTYFVQPFKNIDQLTEFLKDPSNRNQSSSKSGSPQNSAKPQAASLSDDAINIADLKKQMKIIKQKAREEHKARKDAEAEILDLENSLKSMKNQFEQDKKSFENKLNDYQRKIEISDLQNKALTSKYENKIAELNALLEEAQRNLDFHTSLKNSSVPANQNSQKTGTPTTEVEQLKEKVAQNAAKLRETQASIYALRKQNSQLVNQLNESESAKEILRRKNSSLNEDLDKFKNITDNLKSENSKLVIERDDLREQNDSTLTQLQAARTSFNQSKTACSEADSRIEKLQSSLSILEIMIGKQKEEITEHVNARNRYVTALHRQNAALHSMEDVLTSLQEENKKLKDRIDKQNDINRYQLSPKTSENAEIPPTSWYCIDFPRQLCAQISDIANNGSLQTTVKLRNVLGTIAKYYNKKLEDTTKEVNHMKEQEQNNIEKVDSLLTSLGPLVNDSSLSYESFIPNSIRKTQSIVNFINDLQSSQIEAKLSKTQLQNEISDLVSKFGAQSLPDAVALVDKIFEENEKLRDHADNSRTKVKKLAKTIRAVKNAAKQEVNESHEQVNAHIESINKLQEENDRLRESNKHNDDVIEQLTSQISNIQSSSFLSSPSNAKPDTKKQSSRERLRAMLDAQRDEYDKALACKDEQIHDLNDKLDLLEKDAKQFRKIAEILKANKAEKDTQIQSLMNQMDEREKEFKVKLDNEKTSLRDQFERSVSQIKAKNVQLRDLVSNISGALNDSEERNKSLLALNVQLSIEKQHIAAKMETISEEQSRTKQLNEARIKTLELAMSTQRQMELEEERSKLDEQKRQIYVFVAQQFRQLFQARELLNEDGFKSLISRCSDELNRLLKIEASLRRILGLNKGESIEDTVSNLLVSMYSNNKKY